MAEVEGEADSDHRIPEELQQPQTRMMERADESLMAGSPRVSVPGYGVLKTPGNWDEGRPAATSAKPESGPKENINVCVPSASVMSPSPPEICWHLIAPFTVPGVGTTHCCDPVVGTVNCVGPL